MITVASLRVSTRSPRRHSLFGAWQARLNGSESCSFAMADWRASNRGSIRGRRRRGGFEEGEGDFEAMGRERAGGGAPLSGRPSGAARRAASMGIVACAWGKRNQPDNGRWRWRHASRRDYGARHERGSGLRPRRGRGRDGVDSRFPSDRRTRVIRRCSALRGTARSGCKSPRCCWRRS